MPNLNKVMLMGNLTRDPELRYTPSGTAVADIGLAVNRRRKGQDGEWHEEATFITVTAWGRHAEVINEYLAKGRQVYIEGRIVNRSYDDKDGNKKYISEVVVQNFQFIGGRGGDASGGGPAPQRESGGAPVSEGTAPDDDDLPF